MYKNFFGFKEKPFKLVPNPAYLFLSKSHEEALAHLNYAVSQEEGFVGITGEVGTGKTTLCRAFLENLNDNCDAAYIFNLAYLDGRGFSQRVYLDGQGQIYRSLIQQENTYALDRTSIEDVVREFPEHAQRILRNSQMLK